MASSAARGDEKEVDRQGCFLFRILNWAWGWTGASSSAKTGGAGQLTRRGMKKILTEGDIWSMCLESLDRNKTLRGEEEVSLKLTELFQNALDAIQGDLYFSLLCERGLYPIKCQDHSGF